MPVLEGIFLNKGLCLIGLNIILSLFLVNECGYRIGLNYSDNSRVGSRGKTVGTVTGAMMALFGFLLAIPISMAESNFESRRKLILDEANAISTSYLRFQTVGRPHGQKIGRLLIDYTKLRIDFFDAGEDQQSLSRIYVHS